MEFRITSKAFQNNTPLPSRFTGDGANVSPALDWENVPEGAKAFALVCDDPDAPGGTWVHWVLYDIPADMRTLDEGMPRDAKVLGTAKQGRNDFRRSGYDGPTPPRGKVHRYLFRLYALDRETDLAAGATKAEVIAAIEGHVLAEAILAGTYKR